MARSVGLAFQGGGAKVVGLIAAADAISDLVRDGYLKIDAISGTSAGSLAALLLSAKVDPAKVKPISAASEKQTSDKVDFARVKQSLREQGDLIKRRFPKPSGAAAYSKAAKFLVFGSPVFNVRDFNNMLEAILLDAGVDINEQIQDVAKTFALYVIVSDIFRGKSVPLSTGGLRDVLRRSCAIPFVFTSHKSEDQGQFGDGGIFDNLPTDVLVNSLGSEVPVFAIGFQPDRVDAPTSSFGYITSLLGSVVTNNVARSCETIGKEYVCPVATSLGTLDFNKIVSVGLDVEYDAIKAATTTFFKKWLEGNAGNGPQTAGQRSVAKLKDIERKLISHVDAAFRAVPGRHEYVKMSVVANSLEYSHVADDIRIEQLLVLPPGYSLHGTIIPLIDGTGTPDRIECVVKMNGPSGDDVAFTQFLVDDETEVNGITTRRNSLAILFTDNIVAPIARKLYIEKRETRFGFMAPLRSGSDQLALTASYWAADVVSIQLSVPAPYTSLRSDWAPRGSTYPCQEAPQRRDDPKGGWLTTAASIQNVSQGGQLKGFFRQQGAGRPIWIDFRPPTPNNPQRGVF